MVNYSSLAHRRQHPSFGWQHCHLLLAAPALIACTIAADRLHHRSLKVCNTTTDVYNTAPDSVKHCSTPLEVLVVAIGSIWWQTFAAQLVSSIHRLNHHFYELVASHVILCSSQVCHLQLWWNT
jgi:hypothetical protein